MSDEIASKKLAEQTTARIRDATMNNKRLLPGDVITQQEARQLFRPQPEPEPCSFYIPLPGINSWHPAWQTPIPNTEHQDHLDEPRQLFRRQPEQPPSVFYITLPGINGWHPAWQPPISNTEHQDHLDDIPPLLPPTFQSTSTCEFSVSTIKKTAQHSDGPCELWKAKLTQDTYVCGSGGEQKPSHP